IANFALNIERYNLPADYYRTYLEKLSAVTAEDVTAMAKKYLEPGSSIILAVGEADKIEESMRAFSPTGKVTRYDFYGNEVKGAVAVDNITAREVIERYITAIGGVDAINRIEDITTTAAMSVQGMELKMVSRQKAPDKVLVETFMGNNLLSKQIYDGVKGKIVSPMGEQQLDEEMLQEVKESAAIISELTYFNEGFSVELLGIEAIDGSDCYKISVTRPSGKSSIAYYAVADGLKYREIAETPQGSMVTNIKEYTEAEGCLFPGSVNQAIGPQSFDITIGQIEINTGLDDALFTN
ncbi:MAG: insulinase family protein, partial [Bacteroidales bacterium]|nr:insulinase family protein [Bacteroidales bacterium]